MTACPVCNQRVKATNEPHDDRRGHHCTGRRGPGRPPKGDAVRTVDVTVRLTEAEAAIMDADRGTVSRSEWLANRAGFKRV